VTVIIIDIFGLVGVSDREEISSCVIRHQRCPSGGVYDLGNVVTCIVENRG
jgi:hypothetical protein